MSWIPSCPVTTENEIVAVAVNESTAFELAGEVVGEVLAGYLALKSSPTYLPGKGIRRANPGTA